MKKTLTRAELVEALMIERSFDKTEATHFVSLFYQTICNALQSGEPVHLSGFGNFNVIDKKARPGRNPKTGKPHIIAARRVVTFKAGKKLINVMANT